MELFTISKPRLKEKVNAVDDLFMSVIDNTTYMYINMEYLGCYDFHKELIVISIDDAIKRFKFPKESKIVSYIKSGYLRHLYNDIVFYN